MNTDYKQGPWRSVGPVIVDIDTDVEVAECTTNFTDRSDKARLMAAAPDLLEALKMCLPLIDDYDGKDSPEAIAARTAIAIAIGGEK